MHVGSAATRRRSDHGATYDEGMNQQGVLADVLRQRIIDGDFAPGSRLSESALAEQFDVVDEIADEQERRVATRHEERDRRQLQLTDLTDRPSQPVPLQQVSTDVAHQVVHSVQRDVK